MLAFDFQNVPADVAWVKSPGVRVHQAGQAGNHEQKLECHSQRNHDVIFPTGCFR